MSWTSSTLASRPRHLAVEAKRRDPSGSTMAAVTDLIVGSTAWAAPSGGTGRPDFPAPRIGQSAIAVPGCGRLAVARGLGGRSVVTRAHATSPLRLLTPQNHGSGAWVYMSSYGGGLVDGDRIALDVEIGAGATAFLSTQASTKVYRSALGTSSEMRARIAEKALLTVMPDPVVCFAASRYRQTQSFDLSADGGLVLVDWVSSGRLASGERWAFDEYVARLRACVDGRVVLHDALALRGADGDLRDRLGRFNALAVVLILGVRLRERAAEVVARVAHTPVRRRPEQLAAATPVGECGCLVRVAGTSVEQTARAVREYLEFLPGLLGDDPWARKW
jgi:urease accessory protein